MTTVTPDHRGKGLFTALGLVLVIIATEYLTRHYIIYWLPVIGTLRVNDMIVSGSGYLALAWLTAPANVRSLSHLRRTLAEIWGFIKNSSVQVAAALALGTGWLSLLDERLWGDVEIPFLVSPWQSDIILLEPIGLVLGVISLLLVNGVVVPLVEEWLWRGLIQPRVTGALGYITGLIITSILFSFKHVIIDGSLGRMLTLTAFGIIMGITGARLGWRAAAMAHALANTVATIIGLIVSGGQL